MRELGQRCYVVLYRVVYYLYSNFDGNCGGVFFLFFVRKYGGFCRSARLENKLLMGGKVKC